jgi:predicted PurR-regulated permease PerM
MSPDPAPPPDSLPPASEVGSDRGRLSLPGRPQRVSRKHWLLTASAVAVLAVLVLAHEILLPFVLALVLAYVFTPSVLYLERNRCPRWIAILGIYVATLGSLYGFGRLAAPRIAAEARAFGTELPKNVKKIEEEMIPEWEAKLRSLSSETPLPDAVTTPPPDPEEWKPAIRITPRDDGAYDIDVGNGVEIRPLDGGAYRIEEVERHKKGVFARARAYAQRNYMELARGGVAFVQNVARGIFVFFMTLMVAAYLMLTQEKIIGFFRGLVRPSARRDFDGLLTRIDAGLSGVVRGQLLICLVNGILTAIGYALIGVKYWPVLSLIAAVGSLIPIFGVVLTSVPAVAIGLTQSPATGFLVLGWIILIHQIEANFLNPKIIGTAAKLHPVLVIFSLLVGEHFFHAAGALLAVPALSMAQSLFLHFREVADRDELTLEPPS